MGDDVLAFGEIEPETLDTNRNRNIFDGSASYIEFPKSRSIVAPLNHRKAKIGVMAFDHSVPCRWAVGADDSTNAALARLSEDLT